MKAHNFNNNIKIPINTHGDSGYPVYREIEKYFADMIIRQEFPAGSRLPSINEVAASAGINKRTVMQAYQCLEDRGLVEARKGIGTFVAGVHENSIAAIGLVGWSEDDLYAYSGHHYGQAVYAGIREEATRRNLDYRWVKMTTELIDECREKAVSGCILMGTGSSSRLLLESLDRRRLKAVTISGRDDQTVPLVRGDDDQGMHLLLEHLFSLGHRRIALFYGNPGNYSAQRRFAVYQSRMSQKNLDINPSWVCDDSRFAGNPNELDRLLGKWFGSARPPTAIIAAGEHSALATLQALSRQGIRVPEDVSVCGYDDFPGIQEFATPALTVIRQPVIEIGRTAVRNLIALLGGEQVEHAVLPVELIVRDSTMEAKNE